MTMAGWTQVLMFLLTLGLITAPFGAYLHRVFESDARPMRRWSGPVEAWLLRLIGAESAEEQTWIEYARAFLLFSLTGVLVTYAIQRLQGLLPLNPDHLDAVRPDLAFNTAVSFVSNTSWQSYAGETTLSVFSQIAAVTWQSFASAAAGIATALAVARGLTRPEGRTSLGNFWVDVNRALLYVLVPISSVTALIMVGNGAVQTWKPSVPVTTLEGRRQTLALGPAASQASIKCLGSDGGGVYNVNSAHPFDNPTPLVNFLQMLLMLAVPAGLTYTFGKMANDTRQGWTLFAAMMAMLVVGIGMTYQSEALPGCALSGLLQKSAGGNLEGKEVRFGAAGSALFATVTTAASCGAVNCMHDSQNPLGGLVALFNIQVGEVVFGGVGSGLIGMLVHVFVAVFLAGLMVGRMPEYLGKKIDASAMKVSVLYLLVFPLSALGLTALAAVLPVGTSSVSSSGPHGLTQILYAFSSAGGNNGSAFAGLFANTPFWNNALSLAMLVGRFFTIVPALALAGSMVSRRVVPPSSGTFPTTGPLFVMLLCGCIVVVGALTFLPALFLGPILEHCAALHGKVF